MRVFMYDDTRNISCIKRMFGPGSLRHDIKIDIANADIVMARPFRWDGETETIIADQMNAREIIENNPPFDIWILDNDMTLDVEGFHFLKEMLAAHPEKAPQQVISCSSNLPRREDIEVYFVNWLTAQRESKQ